jgi:hypothetical protein
MSEILPQPTDNDERRLWFDYIKAVNERRLQSTQRSGITSYVLLATLVGLFYRFGPAVPEFFTQSGKVRAAVAIFVLLTVILLGFSIGMAALEIFCAGEGEFRATPKSAETLIPFFVGVGSFCGAVVILLEVWVAISTFSQMKFAKVVVITNAVWLAVNIIYPIARYRQLARKAKNIKNPLPRFGLFRQPRWSSLLGSCLAFTWTVLGMIALIQYLRTLPNYGIPPFKAAGMGVVVISIISFMVLRSLGDAIQSQYFGLERDIVLNRMAPSEISDRYLRDLSGPDMAQWLDDSLVTLDRKEEHLQLETKSAQEKLKEISQIRVEYGTERKQRAETAILRLRKALDDCLSQYDALTFQADFFLNTYKTQEENVALRERFTILKEKFLAYKERASETLNVLDELAKITQT